MRGTNYKHEAQTEGHGKINCARGLSILDVNGPPSLLHFM
jgi:hypothetical protein